MRNAKAGKKRPKKHIRRNRTDEMELFEGGTWIIIKSYEHRKIETFTVNCEQRAMNNETLHAALDGAKRKEKRIFYFPFENRNRLRSHLIGGVFVRQIWFSCNNNNHEKIEHQTE